MKWVTLFAVVALGLFGCGKKPAPPPASAEQKSAEPTGGAPPAPPPKYITANAQNTPAENVTGEVNAFLTEQLRIFIQAKGRMPESFAELARTRLDSMPRAPAGKKWVIDTASKEVKAAAAQ